MKNTIRKILSSLLILSFLVSAMAVFSFAESTTPDPGVDDGKYQVFVNRTFDDGWEFSNGMSTVTPNGNSITIEYEEDALYNYNYFTRFMATSNNLTTARFDLSEYTIFPATNAETFIAEFSIKADDVATLGTIASATSAAKGTQFTVAYVDGKGDLILFYKENYEDHDDNPYNDPNINIGKLENEWINIGVIFDCTEVQKMKAQIWWGTGDGYQYHQDVEFLYSKDGDGGLSYFNFHIPKLQDRPGGDADKTDGMSWCLDNLKFYYGTDTFQNLNMNNRGERIDTYAPKTVDIKKNATELTRSQIIANALAMKLGVDSALIRNKKYPLSNNSASTEYTGNYGTPALDEAGNVMIPLELILDYIGLRFEPHQDGKSFDITTGTSTTSIQVGNVFALVNGVRTELKSAPKVISGASGKPYIAIALEDVATIFPGLLSLYDEVGFIFIYEDNTPENPDDNAPILTRESDLGTMVDIMKRFVFDTADLEKLEDSYVATGNAVYEAAKKNTDNFAHPYLLADASVFNNLKVAFSLNAGQAGYDQVLKAYIQRIVDEARAYYNANANTEGNRYLGIKEGKTPVNLYYDGKDDVPDSNDGYDLVHGRLDIIVEYTEMLPILAFAYQVTGDLNYARLAYDWSVALSEWAHWGPAYFENCAEATASYALSYDWLYNAYVELGKDPNVVRDAIYEFGVRDGYISSSGQECEHPASHGDYSYYLDYTNEKIAVCTSGMILGSLAILDTENEKVRSEAIYLIGNNVQGMINKGLDVYAPAGAYDQTPVQWERGTSAFFHMVMALISSTGSDLGFMKSVGIDKTCYYAVYIESPDGKYWNYNDTTETGYLNTDMFNFVGAYYGDAELINIRAHQINAGKRVTIFDLISYPFDTEIKNPNVSNNYYMEGLEAFIYKSDWTAGALYTGMMGGSNSGDMAQIDSGNFIYHNKGIAWFIDAGGENPGVYGYNDAAQRYKYYRVNAEGQNVLYVLSHPKMPFGQLAEGNGVIVKTMENEHGAFAMLDNTTSYGGYVSHAYRGVLVTNDEKTVVLQDEISFIGSSSVCWSLQTTQEVRVDVNNPQIAYIIGKDANGVEYTLRATMVTKMKYFRFSVLDSSASNNLLGHTSPATGGTVEEASRNRIKRLVIKLDEPIGTFNVAVVFEMLDKTELGNPVTYEWAKISDWVPATFVPSEEEDGPAKRPTPDKYNIIDYTAITGNLLLKEEVFSTMLVELLDAIATVEYAAIQYEVDTLDDRHEECYYKEFLTLASEYTYYADWINEEIESINDFVTILSGGYVD